MSNQLLLVTSNPGKVREVEAILGFPVAQLDLDLPEIQALDVEEVVRQKAQSAYEHVGQDSGQIIIVEDTGLYLNALNGLPGALVKWFLETIGPAGIAALVPPEADRAAVARTAVAINEDGKVTILTGETRGIVTTAPWGDGGFGWDPIFQPDGSDKTFAEMDQAERNHYSMRRLALEHLRERLSQRGARS